MPDDALFDPDVATVASDDEQTIERMARALFRHDAKRGQTPPQNYPMVWKRVRPEYVRQAELAWEAARGG